MNTQHHSRGVLTVILLVSVGLASLSSAASYPDMPGIVEPTTNYPDAFASFNPSLLIDIGISVDVNAPQIAEWIRQNQPGDTLALTAEGMSGGVQFEIYGEGSGISLGIVSNFVGSSCAVTLPASLPSGDLYLLWPKNGYGYGTPVAINKTEAWWIGSTRIGAGDTFSVYGRNLSLGGGDCYLYIDGYGMITNRTSNPYKADFVCPDLQDGIYTVYAHNGHGRKYGWSASLELEVYTKTKWDENKSNWIDVTDYGATGDGITDDRNAIMAAWAAVPAYGTLYFPTGTYAYASQLDFGYPKNKRIVGDGPADSTLFASGSSYPLSRSISIKPEKCEISSLGFSCGPTFHQNLLFSNTSQDCVITNCIFDDSTGNYSGDEGTAINNVVLSGGRNLRIENCKFVTYKGVFVTGVGLYVKNCEFRGWGDDYCTYLLCINGSKQVSITGCSGQPHDTSDYTQPDGWTQGRFIYMDGNAGGVEHIYIADSETHEMAPRYNWDIDLYGGRHLLTTNATASTTSPNTVTVPGLDSIYDGTNQLHVAVGDKFQVLDGAGESGRTYIISSLDEGAGVIGIDDPWHETAGAPANGSLLYIKSSLPIQAHLNAGEQILAEHQRTSWRGGVISATSDEVSLASGAGNYVQANYHMVTVVKGKGFGQSRRIISMNNDTATLSEPWNVIPDSTSTIAAGAYNHRIVVYNNSFDGPDWLSLPVDVNNRTTPYDMGETSPVDTASTAVSFYGAHNDCIVANNIIKEVGDGISNYGFLDDGIFDPNISVVMPNYFNLFAGNSFNQCRRAMINVIGKSSSAPVANQSDVAILSSVWRRNTYTNITVEPVTESSTGFPEITIVQSVYSSNGEPSDTALSQIRTSYQWSDASAEHTIEIFNAGTTNYYFVAPGVTEFVVEPNMVTGDWFHIKIMEKVGTSSLLLLQEWRGTSPDSIPNE